jgi:hypothetical protein
MTALFYRFSKALTFPMRYILGGAIRVPVKKGAKKIMYFIVSFPSNLTVVGYELCCACISFGGHKCFAVRLLRIAFENFNLEKYESVFQSFQYTTVFPYIVGVRTVEYNA